MTSLIPVIEQARTRRPVEIYRFMVGPMDDPVGQYYYTSSDAAITYNGHEYVPAPLTRSAVQFDGEMKVSGLTVSIAESAAPINRFLSQWPLGRVWVEILKVYRDYTAEALVVFLARRPRPGYPGAAATWSAWDSSIFGPEAADPEFSDKVQFSVVRRAV